MADIVLQNRKSVMRMATLKAVRITMGFVLLFSADPEILARGRKSTQNRFTPISDAWNNAKRQLNGHWVFSPFGQPTGRCFNSF